MNKNRRTYLEGVIRALNFSMEQITGARDEEQEYLDNMPENLLESERASRAEEAISGMDYALDYLEDAISSLEDAIQ